MKSASFIYILLVIYICTSNACENGLLINFCTLPNMSTFHDYQFVMFISHFVLLFMDLLYTGFELVIRFIERL
jgi:hypothetical protein